MNNLYLIAFIASLLFYSPIIGQSTWSGSGDGTSWDDPMNWQNAQVPMTDSIVTINIDAVITGTMTNPPVQIKINGSSTVTLDLDLTVGKEESDLHTFIVNDSCSLTLGGVGSMRNIHVTSPSDKHTFAAFGSADEASITIVEGTTVTVENAQIGFNISNPTATFTNEGTIIGNNLKDGIKVIGTVINRGDMTFNQPTRDGLWTDAGGEIINEVNGSIKVDKAFDDGIEIKGDGTFTNNGALDITAKDDAQSSETCITVGTDMIGGTFINTSTNVLLNGGLDTFSRTVFINDFGLMSNEGILTLSGGDEGARLFIKGELTNEINAIIDLTDGRFSVNATGTFTNNGLIKTTRQGSGGFAAGVLVNNAFYDYENSNALANGSGDITNNGINLNDESQTVIDANGGCVVDIAEAAYEWFVDNELIAAADENGVFTLPENSLPADSTVLTTTLEGVEIAVKNVCPEALMIIDGLSPEAVRELKLYPNLVNGQSRVNVELPENVGPSNITFDVFNISGEKIFTFNGTNISGQGIDVSGLKAGTYIVKSQNHLPHYIGKFIVVF